jgi:hypothetical protein
VEEALRIVAAGASLLRLTPQQRRWCTRVLAAQGEGAWAPGAARRCDDVTLANAVLDAVYPG